MTFVLSLSFAALTAVAPVPVPSAPAPAITVAWRDRPPYHYTENGVDKGVVLERARQVFADAGLATRFVKMPSKRIWANFVAHTSNFCSIGWYRIPEREPYSQFSSPILSDPPQIVLVAPAAAARVDRHATLAALLADPSLSLGLVDGVSYGPQLDARIRGAASQAVLRTVDASSMMRMVAAGRFAFTFSDVDDWRYAREHDTSLQAALRRDYPDMPPGLKRYIMCTKDVPAASMARLNHAIEALKTDPARLP
jgi:polar amino acid transport system substrate-binding protein